MENDTFDFLSSDLYLLQKNISRISFEKIGSLIKIAVVVQEERLDFRLDFRVGSHLSQFAGRIDEAGFWVIRKTGWRNYKCLHHELYKNIILLPWEQHIPLAAHLPVSPRHMANPAIQGREKRLSFLQRFVSGVPMKQPDVGLQQIWGPKQRPRSSLPQAGH